MPDAASIPMTPSVSRFSAGRFLRAIFVEGGRFWERGRLAYNGVQLLVTGVVLIVRHSDFHYFVDRLGSFVVFALIANVLYTAAYLAEAILQIPPLRRCTVPARWGVFIVGTLVSCCLTFVVLVVSILADPAED